MDNYIFMLSDKVKRQPVCYRNRFGIELIGDLHQPVNRGLSTFCEALR